MFSLPQKTEDRRQKRQKDNLRNQCIISSQRWLGLETETRFKGFAWLDRLDVGSEWIKWFEFLGACEWSWWEKQCRGDVLLIPLILYGIVYIVELFVVYVVGDIQSVLWNLGCCSDFLESVGREYRGVEGGGGMYS